MYTGTILYIPKVYHRRIRNLADLRNDITNAIQKLAPEMIECASRVTADPFELC